MNVYEVFTETHSGNVLRKIVVARDIRGVFLALKRVGYYTDVSTLRRTDRVAAIEEVKK